MKLGIQLDLRNPPGWRQEPSRLYSFMLELCEEAEHLGAASIWLSEHHLFEDDHISQPLAFAAAVAARTSRVRIGTAVVVAPLHHPAEIAEQAALVDVLSGGRLDLGLGAGYAPKEFALFDADRARRFETLDDRVSELHSLWDDGGISPRPYQEQVPVWLGYTTRKGARRAGRLGTGLLSADAQLWDAYRTGLLEGGHGESSGRMAGGVYAWVTNDPEGDWPVVSKHLEYKQSSYRIAAMAGSDGVPPVVDTEAMRAKGIGGPLDAFLLATPEQAAREINAYVGSAPVEQVFVHVSIAGMEEAMVVQHLQTLCCDLAPLLDEESTDA